MGLKQAVEGDFEVQLLGCDSPMPGCILLVDEFDSKYGLGAVNGCCFLYTASQQSAQLVERETRQHTKRMLPDQWSSTQF